MNVVEHVLSPPIVQRIGWTLVHFVWEAAILVLFVAGLLAFLRGRSAASRYVTACAGLSALALLPLLTFCFMSFPDPGQVSVPQGARDGTSQAGTAPPSSAEPGPRGDVAAGRGAAGASGTAVPHAPRGRVSWAGAPPDAVTLRFRKKGFMGRGGLELVASEAEHVVTLDPALRISGIVVDDRTGEPLDLGELALDVPEER